MRILNAPHPGGISVVVDRQWRRRVTLEAIPIVAVMVERNGIGVGDRVIKPEVPVFLWDGSKCCPLEIIQKVARHPEIRHGQVLERRLGHRAEHIGRNDVVGEKDFR